MTTPTRAAYSGKTPFTVLAVGLLAVLIVLIGACSNPLLQKASEAKAKSESPTITLKLADGTVLKSGDVVDFGNLSFGTPKDVTLTVANTGKSALTVAADGIRIVEVADGDSTRFSLPGSAAIALAPGASTTLTLRLSADAAGDKLATLAVASNDAATPTFSLRLKGNVAEQHKAAMPMFNPPADSYSGPRNVTISCATPDAVIRYTTNGDTPSETIGTTYAGPVTVAGSLTLKAIAFKAGLEASTMASAAYVILPSAPTGLRVDKLTAGDIHTTLRISWTAVPEATNGYIVYRDTSATGNFDTSFPVAAGATTMDDTTCVPGRTYFYKIQSRNSTGGSKLVDSETKSATLDGMAVSAVAITEAAISIGVGGSTTLSSSVSPASPTIATLSWSSSNTSIATVVNGTVTGIALGTATITATAQDNSGFSDSCTVTVIPPAPGNVAATASNKTISLSWNAVANATSYTVYYKLGTAVSPGDAGASTITTSATSWEFTGLTEFSTYAFVVVAVTAAGTGASSETVTGIPAYAVGDTGPGGGKIFYVTTAGRTLFGEGTDTTLHYLEVAPVDQNPGIQLWSGSLTLTANYGWIGHGKRNTNRLVTALSAPNPVQDSAAKACKDYRGGGMDDWFLPSRDELMTLYNSGVGSLDPLKSYWSSTQSTTQWAYLHGAACPEGSATNTYHAMSIRAIRAF